MPASLNITVRQSRQSGVAGRHDQFQTESVLRSSGICTCALASSKKLIVFSCHLECGIKKLISQGAGFDVYVLSLLYSICMAFISGKIDDIVGFLITIATLIIIIIIMILCFDESFQDDVEEAANHLGVNVAVLALILSLISLIK